MIYSCYYLRTVYILLSNDDLVLTRKTLGKKFGAGGVRPPPYDEGFGAGGVGPPPHDERFGAGGGRPPPHDEECPPLEPPPRKLRVPALGANEGENGNFV